MQTKVATRNMKYCDWNLIPAHLEQKLEVTGEGAPRKQPDARVLGL